MFCKKDNNNENTKSVFIDPDLPDAHAFRSRAEGRQFKTVPYSERNPALTGKGLHSRNLRLLTPEER